LISPEGPDRDAIHFLRGRSSATPASDKFRIMSPGPELLHLVESDA
jgi:hypothetical protein